MSSFYNIQEKIQEQNDESHALSCEISVKRKEKALNYKENLSYKKFSGNTEYSLSIFESHANNSTKEKRPRAATFFNIINPATTQESL